MVWTLSVDIVFEAPTIDKEEFEKVRGKHVAIVHNKIMAVGNTSKEAFEEALRKNPKLKTSDIALYYVPVADELIL